MRILGNLGFVRKWKEKGMNMEIVVMGMLVVVRRCSGGGWKMGGGDGYVFWAVKWWLVALGMREERKGGCTAR
jgi:hypothetical protein